MVTSAVFPGLCASCVHGQTIESSKSSTFLLCRLSVTDPRYAKYPRLPVVSCQGYQPRGTGQRGLTLASPAAHERKRMRSHAENASRVPAAWRWSVAFRRFGNSKG